MFSSSVTNDINVNTGDIAISSTVELPNAWSTSQGGEQDTAENSGSETFLIFPATGGNVSVGEDGRISISGMGLGNSCIEVAGLGGTMNIYGGTLSIGGGYNGFYYLPNTTRTQGATGAIFVYGGKFLHFDPSKGDDSSTSNGGSNSSVQSSYLAEGYISVASGEYFIVREA
mgnify:FL=1